VQDARIPSILRSSGFFLTILLPHLVVAGDGNVHISQWRVGVAQGNGGDVDVGCLSQWLMVSARIRHNEEAGLPESSLDLIGECSRGEATVEGGSTGGGSKLQNGSLKQAEMSQTQTKTSISFL